MGVWAVQRTNQPREGELGMTGMKGRAARGYLRDPAALPSNQHCRLGTARCNGAVVEL